MRNLYPLSLNPRCVALGSYFRFIDSCTTQLEAQGPSRTCHENKEEKTEEALGFRRIRLDDGIPVIASGGQYSSSFLSLSSLELSVTKVHER